MVPAMNQVLANPKKPEHEAIIAAAFGPSGIKNTDKIKAALALANAGNYRVNAVPRNFHRPNSVASTWHTPTHLVWPNGPPPEGQPKEFLAVDGRIMSPDFISFSSRFHSEQFVAVMFCVYANHHRSP
jgi:hypothetical protein